MSAIDRVDSLNAVAEARQPGITMCVDVHGGTARMREKPETYLPMFPGERTRPSTHTDRLRRTIAFNGFRRAVEGMVGLIFRRDPVLGEDVPRSIAGDRDDRNWGGDWENIDLQGTHGDVFLRRLTASALTQGLAGILVDYPTMDGLLDLGTERALGLRPYWVPIEYRQIVSFRTTMEAGRLVLAQLVLCFEHHRPKGEFAEERVEEYRVYRRAEGAVTYAVWEKRDGGIPQFVGEGVIRNQTEIPFAPCYAGEPTAPLDITPPLLDLAYTVIAHYQTRSDHRTSLHYASQPIYCFIGMDAPDGEKVTGSGYAEYIPLGGDAKVLEHTGAALGATRQELEDLKGEMATLSLAMLQRDVRAAETAEGKRIDKAASDSGLMVLARSLQDCVEAALLYHANYRREKDGGSITINRDFETLRLEAADVQTLSALVAAGQLSLETMWRRLVQGEWLDNDFSPEEERDAINQGALEMAEFADQKMSATEKAAAEAETQATVMGAQSSMKDGKAAA